MVAGGLRWGGAAESFPSNLFFHVDHRERLAVHQWNGDAFHGDIAFRAEEFCTGQRCPHLVASKPGGSRCLFASLEDHAADSATRPVRMDEESANLCRIVKRVQQHILASRPMVAPVERLAFAP